MIWFCCPKTSSHRAPFLPAGLECSGSLYFVLPKTPTLYTLPSFQAIQCDLPTWILPRIPQAGSEHLLLWNSYSTVSWGTYCYHLKKMFLMFIYFWETEREREREWTGEWQNEREKRETQNPKQAPSSELSAQSPMQLTNHEIMTWAEVGFHLQATTL